VIRAIRLLLPLAVRYWRVLVLALIAIADRLCGRNLADRGSVGL